MPKAIPYEPGDRGPGAHEFSPDKLANILIQVWNDTFPEWQWNTRWPRDLPYWEGVPFGSPGATDPERVPRMETPDDWNDRLQRLLREVTPQGRASGGDANRSQTKRKPGTAPQKPKPPPSIPAVPAPGRQDPGAPPGWNAPLTPGNAHPAAARTPLPPHLQQIADKIAPVVNVGRTRPI